MRTFEHFPEHIPCKICGTNEDKECILIPVDGTDDGNICQAIPIHVDCLMADKFRFNKDVEIFYYKL